MTVPTGLPGIAFSISARYARARAGVPSVSNATTELSASTNTVRYLPSLVVHSRGESCSVVMTGSALRKPRTASLVNMP